MTQSDALIKSAQRTVRLELEAVEALFERINADFVRACELLLACRGRVVVVGMGKSGHIGNKIAATLASTGTPAFFVHPAEASHGDLGMVTEQDVALVFALLAAVAAVAFVRRAWLYEERSDNDD